MLLANGATDEAKSKSHSAAGSHTSSPQGEKMYKHGTGPHTFTNIEHHMIIFLYVLLNFFSCYMLCTECLTSYSCLSCRWLMRVWRNHLHIQALWGRHTHKDGSFIGERAEALVQKVEQAQELTQDGPPLGDSQTGLTSGTPNSSNFSSI